MAAKASTCSPEALKEASTIFFKSIGLEMGSNSAMEVENEKDGKEGVQG